MLFFGKPLSMFLENELKGLNVFWRNQNSANFLAFVWICPALMATASAWMNCQGNKTSNLHNKPTAEIMKTYKAVEVI